MNISTWTPSESAFPDKAFVLRPTNVGQGLFLCESEEDLLEHRTDGTDAFDTLYIDCEKFPQHDLYPICVGGLR